MSTDHIQKYIDETKAQIIKNKEEIERKLKNQEKHKHQNKNYRLDINDYTDTISDVELAKHKGQVLEVKKQSVDFDKENQNNDRIILSSLSELIEVPVGATTKNVLTSKNQQSSNNANIKVNDKCDVQGMISPNSNSFANTNCFTNTVNISKRRNSQLKHLSVSRENEKERLANLFENSKNVFFDCLEKKCLCHNPNKEDCEFLSPNERLAEKFERSEASTVGNNSTTWKHDSKLKTMQLNLSCSNKASTNLSNYKFAGETASSDFINEKLSPVADNEYKFGYDRNCLEKQLIKNNDAVLDSENEESVLETELNNHDGKVIEDKLIVEFDKENRNVDEANPIPLTESKGVPDSSAIRNVLINKNQQHNANVNTNVCDKSDVQEMLPIKQPAVTNNSITNAVKINKGRKSRLKKLPIDMRDNEKARLAKLFEQSNIEFSDCSRKPVCESVNTVDVPMLSPRKKEIDRLADLFEKSETSSVRNKSLTERRHDFKQSSKHLDLSGSCTVSKNLHTRRVQSAAGEVTSQDLINKGCDCNEPKCDCNENLESRDQDDEDSVLDKYNGSDEEVAEDDYSNRLFLKVPKIYVTSPTLTRSPSDPHTTNTLTGYGEYDERRKQLIEQRKRDYFDYVQQARLQMRNSRAACCSHRAGFRDVATQTDYGVNYPSHSREITSTQRPTFLLDNNANDFNLAIRDKTTSRGTCTSISVPVSPSHSERSCTSPVRTPRGRDLHRSTNNLPGSPYLSTYSPVVDNKTNMDPYFDGVVSTTHMKQYIYREELKKQIEERQRLEAERKEKEKREEEAMDRRVREQQEKLRRQYEMEEAQRLEYALRRHIQDDALRQRLAETDTRSPGVHHNHHNSDITPAYPYVNKQRPTVLCNRNITPFISPDDRPLPLPEKNDKQQKNSTIGTNLVATNGTTNTTASENQGVIKSSKPVQLRRSNINNNSNSTNNNTNNNNSTIDGVNSKEIDPLFGVDLLADGNDQFSNDILKANEPLKDKKLLSKEQRQQHEPISQTSEVHNEKQNIIDNDDSSVENHSTNDANSLQNEKRSSSPPVPAFETRMRMLNNYSKILQDKWQVPAVEKMYIRPTAIYNNMRFDQPQSEMPITSTDLETAMRNRSYDVYAVPARYDNVLTQLGSFRRQLQLNHLRMQEQLYHSQQMHNNAQQGHISPNK